MEDYRNLYHQHILTVRKLVLDARYYRCHRAKWELDKSQELLAMADANLGEAEKLLIRIEGEVYGRTRKDNLKEERVPRSAG